MRQISSTDFTLVADLLMKEDSRGALHSYWNSTGPYFDDNPDRADIAANLLRLFDIVGKSDPQYVIEQAIYLHQCSPKSAQPLIEKAADIFLERVPSFIEAYKKFEMPKEVARHQHTLDDDAFNYLHRSGNLVAFSLSDEKGDAVFTWYQKLLEIRSSKEGCSSSDYAAGLAANGRFRNPKHAQAYAASWSELINKIAKEQGNKAAAWAGCQQAHFTFPETEPFCTITTNMAMEYLEKALQDKGVSKKELINGLPYYFGSGSRNPVFAGTVKQFYLANVYLAAEESPISTFIGIEQAAAANDDATLAPAFVELRDALARDIRFVKSHRELSKIIENRCAPT